MADPTDRFVYVTDFASNQMIGYAIQSGAVLNFLINGPFKTGNEPQAIAIDPRGKFIYVANALDSSVSAYVIDLSTGTPSAAVNPTGSGTNSTDTQPVASRSIPHWVAYVYTANFLGNSVSGFRLDPNSRLTHHHAGDALPIGFAAHRSDQCAPWQPLHAVGDAVATAVPQKTKAQPIGWAFCIWNSRTGAPPHLNRRL